MMRRGFREAMLIPVALTASLGLAGCARQISGDVYEGRAAGQVTRTEVGWIESARVVHIQEEDRLEDNRIGLFASVDL